jgi:hypothetical protein
MITELLQHSDAFHEHLDGLIQASPPVPLGQARYSVSAANALVSIEHAIAARQCFGNTLYQSATALIRLQFEALVRGAWALYVATDELIDVMNAPLNAASDESARKLPGATSMLKALSGHAPAGLTDPLEHFHSLAWHGLNSYVHTGIHPIRRRIEGYPVELAVQQVRNGNGLLHLSYRLLAGLTGSSELMAKVTEAWKDHPACLPIGVAA